MENTKILASSGSTITTLDLRNISDEPQANKLECTFWTRQDGQICVHYFRPEKNVFYQPHTHSEYTVMVCLEGELTKTEAGETLVIGPGEVMISNAGVEHATGYLSRCAVVCVTFDSHILSALNEEFQLWDGKAGTRLVFTGSRNNNVVTDCALDIVQELRNCETGHKIVVEVLTMRLLVEMLRTWPRDQIKPSAADAVPRLPQRDFVRAYEFMRRCSKGTFRLQHLCSFLGISKERFTRLFLASTNHTPASFYNRMLLERGRELLRDHSLSIKEISFQLGFKTTSHFIVAFRREFAASPQEYRQHSLPVHCWP